MYRVFSAFGGGKRRDEPLDVFERPGVGLVDRRECRNHPISHVGGVGGAVRLCVECHGRNVSRVLIVADQSRIGDVETFNWSPSASCVDGSK